MQICIKYPTNPVKVAECKKYGNELNWLNNTKDKKEMYVILFSINALT